MESDVTVSCSELVGGRAFSETRRIFVKATIFAMSLLAGVVSLCQESSAATRQYHSPRNAKFTQRPQPVESRRPDIELQPEVAGAIPRALRDGNPLQILNPLAPAKCGFAEENTVVNPDVPGRGEGIKLLSISW
jgi:hypothetical protein